MLIPVRAVFWICNQAINSVWWLYTGHKVYLLSIYFICNKMFVYLYRYSNRNRHQRQSRVWGYPMKPLLTQRMMRFVVH